MTDYKGKVIDTCSDCGKRGPMWSGMPYLCKGCSEKKMNKSNDIFEKAWINVKKGSKPDYLDFDEDGDKKEPMKDALRSKKVKKADMGEKDRYCQKNFGKKYSMCSSKQKAQCDRECGKVEKGMGGCSVCKGGALPCIGKNVMTSHGVMCNNQVLDMTMG